MPRTPIELVRPTFDPGFLGSNFTSGVSAGASAARNQVAYAEIASRERIARADAALKARQLSQQERLALEGMKNDTELFLAQLDQRREAQASEQEFRQGLAREEMSLRKELQDSSPEAAMLKIREQQQDALDRVAAGIRKGLKLNDPSLQSDLLKATSGTQSMDSVLQTIRYGGTGEGSAGVGSIARAMTLAGGDEVRARQIQQQEMNLEAQYQALESQVAQAAQNPELIGSDPKDFDRARRLYISTKAQLNGLREAAGQAPLPGLSIEEMTTQAEKDAAEAERLRKKRDETPTFIQNAISKLTADGTFMPWELVGGTSRLRNIWQPQGVTPRHRQGIDGPAASPARRSGPVSTNVNVRLTQPANQNKPITARRNAEGNFRVEE